MGLTADQLREWTARGRLIEPDAKSNGPGSQARFSRQTVLLLRIAVVLNDTFHVKLQAQRGLFSALSQRLAKMFFSMQQGTTLVLNDQVVFDLVPLDELGASKSDFLIVRFDPHLDVLSTELDLAEPSRRLQLFPAGAVAWWPRASS
jgi:hypothetical protein